MDSVLMPMSAPETGPRPPEEQGAEKGQRITYIYVYACPLAPGRDPPLEFITAQESGLEGARVWLRLGPFPLEVVGGEVAPHAILAQEW